MTDRQKICCVSREKDAQIAALEAANVVYELETDDTEHTTTAGATQTPSAPTGTGWKLVSAVVKTADGNARTILSVNSSAGTITMSGVTATDGVIACVWARVVAA